jgi:hypothetical protein
MVHDDRRLQACIRAGAFAAPRALAGHRPDTLQDSTTLHSLAAIFGDRAEVISDPPDSEHETAVEASEAVMMGLLRRRPCTIQDVSHGLGIPAAAAAKRLELLERAGEIVIRRREGKVFYVPSRPKKHSRER